MLSIYVIALVLLPLLALLADRLRERVTVLRTADQLTIASQRAALRLDGLLFVVFLCGLAAAVAFRSFGAVVFTGVATVTAGWHLLAARRAPDYRFDRGAGLLWRDDERICPLSAIEALVVMPSGGKATLEVRYLGPTGQQRRERLYRARPPKVAAVRAALMEFLAGR